MPFQGVTYTFEDLSETTTPTTNTNPNPYIGLIEACDDDPTKIQARYNTHRTTRTSQQRVLLTSPSFPGVNLDAILIGLLREETKQAQRGIRAPFIGDVDQGLLRGLPEGMAVEGAAPEGEDSAQEFVDHRHNLSFWARPPERIRALVEECQRRLRDVIPDLWLMPLPSLHMTALELTHSRDPATISSLAARAHLLTETLASLPHALANALPSPLYPSPTGPPRRARLVHPAVTYDAAAVALTLVPAAEDPEDAYTYHHLRRDLWETLSETSVLNGDALAGHGAVPVASRYVVPSAHLTIARFVTRWDVVGGSSAEHGEGEGDVDAAKTRRFVEAVDGINAWLERECWGVDGPGKWVVGEEVGLEFHGGASWFGGGEVFAKGRCI